MRQGKIHNELASMEEQLRYIYAANMLTFLFQVYGETPQILLLFVIYLGVRLPVNFKGKLLRVSTQTGDEKIVVVFSFGI